MRLGLALLAFGVGGCGAAADCKGEGCGGGCVGDLCTYDCPDGNCDITCPGPTCTVHCEGPCRPSVACAGDSCSVACEGGGCGTDCTAASCDVACVGNGCQTTCDGADYCAVTDCTKSCVTTCGGRRSASPRATCFRAASSPNRGSRRAGDSSRIGRLPGSTRSRPSAAHRTTWGYSRCSTRAIRACSASTSSVGSTGTQPRLRLARCRCPRRPGGSCSPRSGPRPPAPGPGRASRETPGATPGGC